MPNLFLSQPGNVMVVDAPTLIPAAIAIEGLTLADGSSYGLVRSLVTAVGLSEDVARQVRLSLRNQVYAYVFGDRPGAMVVSGVSFLNPCDGASGMEMMYQYYRFNRATARNSLVRITFGSSTVLKGLLHKFSFNADDTDRVLGRFALELDYIPALDNPEAF